MLYQPIPSILPIVVDAVTKYWGFQEKVKELGELIVNTTCVTLPELGAAPVPTKPVRTYLTSLVTLNGD